MCNKPAVSVPQEVGGVIGMSRTSANAPKPKSDGQIEREAQARASAVKKQKKSRRRIPTRDGFVDGPEPVTYDD